MCVCVCVCVAHKLTRGQGFLRAVRFPPVTFIEPILHTGLHLSTILPERQAGEDWQPLNKAMLLRMSESIVHRKVPWRSDYRGFSPLKPGVYFMSHVL